MQHKNADKPNDMEERKEWIRKLACETGWIESFERGYDNFIRFSRHYIVADIWYDTMSVEIYNARDNRGFVPSCNKMRTLADIVEFFTNPT